MNTVTANSRKGFPKNWKKNEGTFSADSVIDAYLKGIEAGKQEYSLELTSHFSDNLNKAGQAAEELISKLSPLDITVRSVYLKPDEVTTFTVLFIVNDKDFIADHFRDVFTLARTVKNGHINDDFYISFVFMPDSPNLKEHCLIADGYFWKYAKRLTTPATRQA